VNQVLPEVLNSKRQSIVLYKSPNSSQKRAILSHKSPIAQQSQRRSLAEIGNTQQKVLSSLKKREYFEISEGIDLSKDSIV
jgi:hypothetical protein